MTVILFYDITPDPNENPGTSIHPATKTGLTTGSLFSSPASSDDEDDERDTMNGVDDMTHEKRDEEPSDNEQVSFFFIKKHSSLFYRSVGDGEIKFFHLWPVL
jgi:hypothetical protein